MASATTPHPLPARTTSRLYYRSAGKETRRTNILLQDGRKSERSTGKQDMDLDLARQTQIQISNIYTNQYFFPKNTNRFRLPLA